MRLESNNNKNPYLMKKFSLNSSTIPLGFLYWKANITLELNPLFCCMLVRRCTLKSKKQLKTFDLIILGISKLILK